MHENEIGEILEVIPGGGTTQVCFSRLKVSNYPGGYVSACVLDYSKDLIVGDLSKTPLREIWQNIIKFRRRHIKDLKG